MAHPPFDQVLGTIGRRRITVRDGDGDPIPFLFTDPVSAVCWAGDDQEALFSPDVAWVDAPAGVLSLTITSAMTTGLQPGQYRIQAFVTPPSDGERRCVFDGSVRFLPTPGSSAPAKVYATYDDLLFYCPEVGKMQDAHSDQSGFREQRARARTWLDEEILRYYHPQPGRTRRMMDEDGTGPGSVMVYADPPTGSTVPSDVELEAILDADGLVLTDILREAVSHKAASIVYSSSPVGSYAQEGSKHDSLARMHWYRAVIEVKSDPDLDAPDMRIGKDVTFLV